MSRKYKKSDIAKLWRKKQVVKQVFDDDFKKIRRRQEQIEKIYGIDKDLDRMVEEHEIIKILETAQTDDAKLMQEVVDRVGNALHSSIMSYDNAIEYLGEIEINQGIVLNEISSSSASGGTISSGVWDLAQIPDFDSGYITQIEAFTNDLESLDRSSLQAKLDTDLGYFNPELVERRKHAWRDYYSGEDQALRDTCTHLREIIYYFLNEFCPSDKIKKCDWFGKAKKEPHRWDQINYLLKEILEFPDNSVEYGHRYKLIKEVLELLDHLSSLSHFGPKDRVKVYHLIVDVENFLVLLFSKGLEKFN